DHLIVDALVAKLSRQRALAFSRIDAPRTHPLLGEVRVIDEADLGQAVQYPAADTVGIAALEQLPGQFVTRSCPRGDQAQAQRSRLLLAGGLRSRRGRAGLRHWPSQRSTRHRCRASP